MPSTQLQARIRPHLTPLVPGLFAVALMLVWASHNGGYDADTWYWGALLLLAADVALAVALGNHLTVSRTTGVALAAFAAYVLFSYASISWAGSPGDALQGSNRALLYLLLFSFLSALPWTPQAALGTLLAFAIGVGVVAVVVLIRLSSADHVGAMVIEGRLATPTGYFNATAALFTVETLTAIALASRPELPAPLRGLLTAFAAASLQLAVIVQSRGWLFTLPLVAVGAALVVRDRLRFTAAAVLPIAAAVLPLSRLLAVYEKSSAHALPVAASAAGRAGLLICGGALLTGTIVAWLDGNRKPRGREPGRRRLLGTAVIVAAIAAVALTGVKATHGHPIRFIERQWSGFSRPPATASSVSHFADVGSGRYDFWRVSLDAFKNHPLGGLGQDNFADYYILRRRTAENPLSTHSLELRLLAHTGSVGFALFGVFLVAALAAALGNRRRGGELRGWVAGAALLPFVAWSIHGSVDWFWEMPALTGPALGFLAVAGALAPARPGRTASLPAEPTRAARPRVERVLRRSGAKLLAATAVIASVVVLGLPYLSVREASLASDLRSSNPTQALNELSTAAKLNPLNAEPGRLGGTIALQAGRYREAERRFAQATSREPGGWYGWLGRGLAASALGETAEARRDFQVAASINRRQAVIRRALGDVSTSHPLTPGTALELLAHR